MKRAWETARYGDDGTGWPEAELLSMAVAPEHRGEGVGHRLGTALLDEFSDRGIGQVKVVVGGGNEAAVGAYVKMGFVPAGTTEVHPGEMSQVLVWSA